VQNFELNNPLLRRYWFKTKELHGVGVTAYSLEDAKSLVKEVVTYVDWDFDELEIIENVDIRSLDEGHVLPNMGAPNFRGVWYPNLNV
jgi:hypothetical protein